MSAAVGNAVVSNALSEAAQGVFGSASEQVKNSWLGRNFTHWTEPLFGIAALVSAVVAVTGFFTGSSMTITIGVTVIGTGKLASYTGLTACIVSLLAYHYVNSFKSQYDLLQVGEKLDNQVDELENTNDELKSLREDYQSICAELEKKNRKLASLRDKIKTNTRELKSKLKVLGSYSKIIKDAEKGIKDSSNSMGDHNHKLEEYIAQVNSTMGSLEGFSDELDENLEDFITFAEKIDKESDEIAVEVVKLREVVSRVPADIDLVSGAVEKMQGFSQSVEGYCSRLEATERKLEQSKTDLVTMRQSYDVLEKRFLASIERLNAHLPAVAASDPG